MFSGKNHQFKKSSRAVQVLVINGIDKETNVSLFTIDGKLLKQFQVNNLQRQQVNGVANGVYLLNAPGLEAFKVIVAGSSIVSSGTTTVSSQ